mmetsp:Transcript_129228/g.192490  ORF Transcript_129228/g.192490 Transcript_129228/m.192490 type:complete len:162 (-) Transcript_129228:118-603(-)
MFEYDNHDNKETKKKVTPCSVCWILFVLLLNGAQLGIGVWGMDDCASNPIDLGIWMIVAGSTGIVFTLLMFFPKIESVCGCCLGLFGFSWFIVGAVCLFSDGGVDLCADSTVWYWGLAFWILNAILVSVSLCFFCCLVGITALIALIAAKVASDGERSSLV